MALQAYRSALFLGYGALNFTRGAYLKHAKKFDDLALDVSLKGKHAIVTGGNAGIGRAAAEGLAKRGASVCILCRSREKGKAAVEEIASVTGSKDVRFQVCDLSSMASIRAFAAEYIASGQPLHILANNAGVMLHERQLSAEGIELNFATNTLGTYALTELLLPALERSAPSRVVVVSTGGVLSEPLEVDNLQWERGGRFDGTRQYAKNKRQQVALVERWMELYNSKNIGFYAMHPGWVDTATLRVSMPGFYSTFKSRLRTPDEGADTIVWLSCVPKEKLVSGDFYFDRDLAAKHLASVRTQYTPKAIDQFYRKVKSIYEGTLQEVEEPGSLPT